MLNIVNYNLGVSIILDLAKMDMTMSSRTELDQYFKP